MASTIARAVPLGVPAFAAAAVEGEYRHILTKLPPTYSHETLDKELDYLDGLATLLDSKWRIGTCRPLLGVSTDGWYLSLSV